MAFLLKVLLFYGCIYQCLSLEPKDSCFKRFEYEYDVLQKMVQLEETLTKQETKISTLTRELEDASNEIKKLKDTLPLESKSISSTYVRWGRTECPHGAHLVYRGYAAGGLYTKTGAGANKLCLPTDPLWGKYMDGAQSGNEIYGGEYEIHPSYHLKHLHDNDVPCAVCRIPRDNVMIPGRNECYKNYKLEYAGYLMSGHHTHPSSTEYICMDGNPEVLEGGHADQNGVLFYFVEPKCGSLKCPPYVEGRELTCVVCSWNP